MSKKYDGLFIFTGAVKEEAEEKLVEKATAEITRLDGKVLENEIVGRRTFARPMHKQDHGVYIRLRFELDPAKVAELRSRCALNEDIFRVQLLAVDDRYDAALLADKTRRAVHRAKVEAEQAAAEAAAAKAAQTTEA